MKMLEIILILFLALQIAHAETEIFSGKVITDTNKDIDGGIFKFNYDQSSDKVFVQTPAGGLIVENGACKPNDIFRVCINSANFSHKNITTYVYYYELDAVIYKLTGSISASSKAALASLLQHEPTEFTVTITNPTDLDITDIDFRQDLSPFSVANAKGCGLTDNKISWKGSLKPKYDKVCTATITAEKEGKYSLFGKLSYFNGFEAEEMATEALPITVLPKQLKAIQSVDNDTKIKKPFYLNLSLQNIHASEDINGIATITLPSHVSLIKDIPVFEKSAKVLKRSFFLKHNSGINYSLYLEKLSEGTEPVTYKFEYLIKGVDDVVENNTFVDVIATQSISKPAETIQKPEKPEVQANSTSEDTAAPEPLIENKTTGAKQQPLNETPGQTAVAEIKDTSKPGRNILLLGIAVLIASLIILLVIFKIRKKKGETI